MVEPVDKFGRPIYPKTFRQMQAQEASLLEAGYREAREKPNLFFRKAGNGVYFADMRSSEDIPIWVNPRPLFYWRFENGRYRWEVRRDLKEERDRLVGLGCPIRYSFYTEEEIGGLFVPDSPDEMEWSELANGSCFECEGPVKGDDLFCSEDCRRRTRRRRTARRITQSPVCEVCTKKIVKAWDGDELDLMEDLPHRLIVHHVSYKDEETIEVCQGCHNKIHHGRDPRYERWRPRDGPPSSW